MPVGVRVGGSGLDGVGVVLRALKVEVGFGDFQLAADKLVVDLVLHLREEDGGGNHAGVVRRLELEADFPVPEVERGGDDPADGVGRHLDDHGVVLVFDLAVVDEVRHGRVSQVVCLVHHVCCSRRVGAGLAGRRRHARRRVERIAGVTRSETVRARPARAFVRAAREVFRTV